MITTKTADNIAKVQARIQQAAAACGRDVNSIRLLAVSKTRTVADIREAFAAGVMDFGENYAQEAEAKVTGLQDLPITWHFIGPVQSNKAALVARQFDWVHSVDRLPVAERLGRLRPPGRPPLQCCIQVNINDEAGKSGIRSTDLAAFADQVIGIPGLQLRGLMAIPAPVSASHGVDQLECAFKHMHELFVSLQQQFPQTGIDTLSMGMSADLELAIAAGSTLVRVGTDIFGPRR